VVDVPCSVELPQTTVEVHLIAESISTKLEYFAVGAFMSRSNTMHAYSDVLDTNLMHPTPMRKNWKLL